MALAFDAKTKSSASSGSPWTFTHTPVGVAKAVTLKLSSITATDNVSAISYGGVALTRIGRVVDSAGEAGSAEIWALNSGIPTGPQTVSITFSGSTEKAACCETYTDSGDTVINVSAGTQDDQANPSVTLDTGGATALRTGLVFSGLVSPASLTPNGSMTAVDNHTFGTGSKCCRFDRETSPSSGATAMGYTSASDDVAMFFVALESAGAGNAVTGSVIQEYSGSGVSGVNISLTGTGGSAGTDYTTTTGAGGTFSKTVASGWTGDITISDANRVATPTSLSLSNVTAGSTGNDFTVVTTYYVDPAGDDSDPGTAAAPFETFEQAASVLDYGETAIFSEDDHDASGGITLDSSMSGSLTHRKTFQAAGSSTRFVGASNVDAFTLNSCDNLVFDGINLSTAKDGFVVSDSANVTIKNNTIEKCESWAVQLEGTGGLTTNFLGQDCNWSNNNGGFRSGHKYPDANIGVGFTLTRVTLKYNCGKACLGRWDGVAASAVGETPGHRNFITGLYKVDDNIQYTCGFGGKICKTTNGSTWSAMTTPATNSLSSIWGSAHDNVWAVGTRGAMWNWNGTTWSASTPITARHLLCVHGSASNNVWACGKYGTILKFNGTSWSAVTSGITTTLRAIYVVDANNVVVVGDGGVIRTTSNGGSAWTSRTSGVATILRAIAKNSTYYFAVGDSDVVLRSADAATWSALTPGTAGEHFRSVTCDDDILWVGGYSNDGPILLNSDDDGATFSDQGSLAVHTNLGWPVNDVNFNGLAILSTGGLLIAGAVYNENSDGVAITQADSDCTYTDIVSSENGDDGFDIYNIHLGNTHTFSGCIAYDNDPFDEHDADGNAYKCGVGQSAAGTADCVFSECVGAGCSRRGFDEVSPMRITLLNCTATLNDQQGVYGGYVLTNVISYGNTGVDFNSLSGTYSYLVYGTGTITGGTHLIAADPVFTDPTTYDFTLQATSPAIDAGTNVGFGNDIGAYQYETPGITAPTVTTTAASSIQSAQAVVGGSATSDGGSVITEKGVVYSTTPGVSLLTGTVLAIGTGLGAFSDTLEGLSSGTTYYFAAYATNASGTSYGSELSFTTSEDSIIIGDGRTAEQEFLFLKGWPV